MTLDKLMRDHPQVSRVDIERLPNALFDITVYFEGSTEPFPLSSIRNDSPLKDDLYWLAYGVSHQNVFNIKATM